MTSIDPEFVSTHLPVWQALSDLFLDNELDQSHFKLIATELGDTGFALLEIEDILWEEVFPALADNLRITTGEWGVFSPEWLQVRILDVMNDPQQGIGGYGLITAEDVRETIADYWAQVRKQLLDQQPND